MHRAPVSFPAILVSKIAFLLSGVVLASASLGGVAGAQVSAGYAANSQPLIKDSIDESRLTVLRGNTHPLARPQFDLGVAPATLPMERMLLVLKRSPDQETALRRLLDNQQDKKSPNYRKWLTPEEFGLQFGPTDADIQTITSWLQSHGFQVGSTKGRTVLEFSGSASQVQQAFHTTIHKYIVNGEQHWANANDPSIPTALAPAVAGVLTLHNFYKKPTIHFSGVPVQAKLQSSRGRQARPQVTFTENGEQIHALSPQDYGVIYNMTDLPVTGESSIAVIGRSNLYEGSLDVSNFEAIFGGGQFFVTLNGPDPGDLGGDEEAEATLDSTWSSTLAPGARTTLVVSASTNTTDGIDLSELYIVEQNLAAIMTESFSACELYATDAELSGASALAEQAAAQGITYMVSTGDDGAEGCDDPSSTSAQYPVSVNYLASTPFNVAVGGTMFNEAGDDSKYWTDATPISESAISYIPENVWNESSSTSGLWAGSGGASAGNIASGVGTTGGVPKPDWQYGVTGIPADGVRDLPDVSLTAAGHDPYLLCLEGSCTPDAQGYIYVYFISGTSASAPSFAGIMALVNNENSIMTGNPRVGLANYTLYRLAASQAVYPSQCNGSNTTALPGTTCIFNDVTEGNNAVPGESGNDYQAGAGYDLATGLGSVNVANLVSQWNTVTFNPTTTTISLGLSTITHGTAMPFTITVAPNSGSGTPTGDAYIFGQGWFGYSPAPTTIGPFPLSGGTVSTSTNSLPGGQYSVTAGYSGDSTFAPSTSAGSSVFTVNPEASTTTLSVLSVDQNGNTIPFTGGPFGSFVYLRADVKGASGYGYPTGTVGLNDTYGSIPGVTSELALNSQGNTATPAGIYTFDTGTHVISASYSGDVSFYPSSTTQAQTFTISAGMFAAVNPSQAVVQISAPGVSGTTSAVVTNSTGFSGTISLACSGLPYEASCTFTPKTVTASGTFGSTSVGISITTTAPTTAANSKQRSALPAVWIMGMGLIFSSVLLGGKRSFARMTFLLLALITVTLVGCGGGGSSGGGGTTGPPPNSGTPAGTSNVVVTATSGSIVSQTGFTLVIQ